MVETAAGPFRWVNVEHPTDEDLQHLRRDFPFHPKDLADLPVPKQRPKFVVRERGAFHILLFPVYHRETRAIRPTELDVFLGADFLVTVHEGGLPLVGEHYAAYRANPKLFPTPLAAFLELLEHMFDGIPPMLEHISVDESAIERGIFAGREHSMVEEILIVRRNITEFRRTMAAHFTLLKRFANELERSGEPEPARRRVLALVERARDIWGHLESLKETIEALQESNESLISFRLNDIMKRFTVISVVIFAMTLAATVLAIRANGTPILEAPGAFLWVLSILAAVGAGMFLFFRRRRWV